MAAKMAKTGLMAPGPKAAFNKAMKVGMPPGAKVKNVGKAAPKPGKMPGRMLGK